MKKNNIFILTTINYGFSIVSNESINEINFSWL